MIKEVIGTGDTPELALLDAKTQLGLGEEDDVDFEVIQKFLKTFKFHKFL